MNWQRIGALLQRHYYVNKRNVARLADIVFWPMADLALFGFISVYLVRSSGAVPAFVAFFIGALILWDTLFRANNGVTVGFLEEIWTKNLLNLFASPLTPREFVASLVLVSLLRVLAGGVVLVAAALVFYGFNIFTLGLPLVAFYINLLLMGWSLGLVVVALILRFGTSAEIFAWALIFLFQPFSAVFYPVSVLPRVFQEIARFVPSSHVFEGMRQVIGQGTFSVVELIWALGLNLVYALAALAIFAAVFRKALASGRLVRSWQ